MTTDPITQFYAPRARLVDADSELVIGGGRGGSSTSDPALDLISARVTLVNTGVGQLQVVLNNQVFGTGDDGLPVVPPWLYNGLDRLRFGQRVRLDLCYGDQPWTKMIVAQINDMQFSFPSGGGAQVTITGEDLLCLYKRKPAADQRYPAGQSEEQIVRDVVERAGGAPAFAGTAVVDGARGDDGWRELRGPLVAWPSITEELPSVTHQKSQTYLQFLQSIADRLDYEIFVDFAKNYLPRDQPGERPQAQTEGTGPVDPAPNEVLLHFEPARSRLGGGVPGFVVELAWGFNLLEFTPKLKVWDLVTAVSVKGRSPATVDRVAHQIDDASEVDAIVTADMGRLPNEPSLVPATALRREFFADVPSEAPLEVDFTNLGPQRARLMAEAKLREKARELITVEASTLGFPSIRAGIHVNITGFYAPFDGLYYVTKAVHSFDSGGYRTQLSLRRPGLQPPGDYIWSLARERRAGAPPEAL
ncbi:phage late control D family protein [Sorangium sp. So ce394]|uniref:Uncharacterized protein n=1 Tax=Sorangium cellulosum TaxID=56 RepID=A0A150S1I8_SORCE|nr:hypothetical protein BE18_36345 [Sorangium cellulosum]KYF86344.1 hypothetical protein BE20_29405 [Sorangium cellulosum]